ncbi:MAG TPA: tRNA threonylcarbamoyladenosine dehydratase [Spirochaetota bacterium]|nr:tRNA threonylcarbamoyladenosine dehydratase [Spirochaetota bacterium]HPI90857.1 tRNA threonylcarbamoyladenosine dehydratase [Spirochaetota bacterium]HPR49945.1 tRNA threonylcarbamoyladenosine dehydratase [Spirochaetota bacterium]
MDTSRTEILTGTEGAAKLAGAAVALFGLGGVGGYALEALARAGIGRLYLFDCDVVAPSNMNRQVLALEKNIGRMKAEVARERVLEINGRADVIICTEHLAAENVPALLPTGAGYAIDAIDEIAPKVALIALLVRREIPFVASMGAGSKLSPHGITVSDISRTTHCPLARAVRSRLKQEGITTGVRCVYSEENLNARVPSEDEHPAKPFTTGSISYVPGLFGLTAAGVIIRDILEKR